MLNAIPAELHEPSQIKTLNEDSTASHSKALGVFWDAHNDIFYVSTGTLASQIASKRYITSDVARFFDVLGWLTPATIFMKVLLQRLWEIKTGWDEEVPHNLQQRHSIWRQQLPCFSKFPFKRFYFFPGVISRTKLHGFSDASEHAYSAVVYIRAVYSNATPSLTLVTAKTKVAPLKRLSIPRLELCGANLLSKLIKVVAWSDSTIVLHLARWQPTTIQDVRWEQSHQHFGASSISCLETCAYIRQSSRLCI